ncbi:hypothetical protein ACBJ59_12090 [Nonomuraea sp. MTCD27]|uniref:hypothetical protein n=1 Tax=Nonomuraea sp. MTCD27 TaxID=1676747 RepID=UPI0035BEFD95
MFKKIAPIAALALVLTGGAGVAAASEATTAAAKPKLYGACVSTKSGAMRLLEPNRLKRSQHGKCRSSERKIYLPTRDGLPVIPPPPATVVYKRVTGVETCVRTTDATLTYECKTAPAPSPTATPTS